MFTTAWAARLAVATLLFVIVTAQQPVPFIDIRNVPTTATQFVTVSWPLVAGGGTPPYTFASYPDVSSLSDLQLNAKSGVISGQIFSTGDFAFVFQVRLAPFSPFLRRRALSPTSQVTDSVGNVAYSQRRFITVGGDTLVMGHFGAVYQCEVGVPCTVTQQVGGKSPCVTFTNFRGALPLGMAWNTANGVLSGTPTGPPATHSNLFENCVTASSFTVNLLFTVIVVSPLRLQATLLQPTCDLNFPFASSLAWTGGPSLVSVVGQPEASLRIDIVTGALPPGVSFTLPPSPTAGAWQVPRLSGSPQAMGPFSIVFKVTDYLGGSATLQYIGDVIGPGSLVINAATAIIGEVGIPHSTSLAQTGGRASSYWFGVVGLPGSSSSLCDVLPAGLTITNTGATAILSGSPTKAGSYDLSIGVQPYFKPNGTSDFVVLGPSVGSPKFVLNVVPRLTLAPQFESQAQAGSVFNLSISATGGVPGTLRYGIINGALPPGLTFEPTTGMLSGLPAKTGTFTFTLEVADSLNARATAAAVITVLEPGGGSLSIGAIVGIAVGALVAVTIATVASVLIYKKWNASRGNVADETPYRSLVDTSSTYKF